MDKSFTKRILNGKPRFKPEKIDEANDERRKALLREKKRADAARDRAKVGDRFRSAAKTGVIAEVRRMVSDEGPLKANGVSIDDGDKLGVNALMYASAFGKALVLDTLLGKKANIDCQASNGSTALMLACKNGHFACVARLLHANANTRLVNNEGWAAISFAADNGNPEAVEALLNVGVDINHRTKKGTTPLMLAAQGNHTEALKVMLNWPGGKLRIDEQSKFGWTALMRACDQGHPDAAEMLLDAGADAELKDFFGSTALMWACASGRLEVVNLLLSRGVSVEPRNHTYKTALMLAEENGHILVVRRMRLAACWEWSDAMAKDAESKVITQEAIADGKGNQLALQAAREGDAYTLWRLAAAGADIKSPDPRTGNTPLMTAAAHGCSVGVDCLLAAGAEPDKVNRTGNTALMLAARRGFLPICKRLVATGTPLEVGNSTGETALHLAAANGHSRVLRILLLAGANPLAATRTTGATPLHKACQAGYPEAAQTIIDLQKTPEDRANVLNAQDLSGWTPVMRAVSKSRRACVAVLVAAEADLFLVNSSGKNVLDIAASMKTGDLKKVIEDEYAASLRRRKEAHLDYHMTATAASTAKTLL